MSGHKGARRMQMARALLAAAVQVDDLLTPHDGLTYLGDPPASAQPDQLALSIVEGLRRAAAILLNSATYPDLTSPDDDEDDDGDEL